MNSEIRILYENDHPVRMKAQKVANLAMHNHPDTIELIYLLKGNAEVKVSFECFSLQTGDFLVVNHGDFHYIKSMGGDTAVLSLYIDLSWLERQFAHIRYVTFACESFLIQDSRKEYVEKIRDIIQSIALDLTLKQDGFRTSLTEKAFGMFLILVERFTILQYYSSGQKLNSQKLEKYYKIMEKLEEGYQNKSLLDEISKSEFYSKFYLAHLFKGMMMMSIQDSLSGMRCFQSEKLLLTTDKSIQEIALDCGFSDVKYYYKHFRRWFNCTPAQYRKRYQAEVFRETVAQELFSDELLILLGRTRLTEERETDLAAEKEEKNEHFSLFFYYTEPEQNEEFRKLISGIREEYPHLKIKELLL